jgi:presenilin-like A22 family membrane protease
MTLPWYTFIIYFAIGTLLIIVFIKFFKRGHFFKFLFGFMLWWGTMKFTGLFLSWEVSIALSVAGVYLYFKYQKIWLHNILLVMPIIMAGCILGFNFQPRDLMIALLILAIYDYIAVIKIKSMIKMFTSLAEKKTIMALIITDSWQNLNYRLKDLKIYLVNPDRRYSFLGTGDLAIPIIFSISVLTRYGLWGGYYVALGATAGLALCNYVLLKYNRPLPGLPFIGLGCVLGYLVYNLSILF